MPVHLPRHASKIDAFFPFERDHQAFPQILPFVFHDLCERVLKQIIAADSDPAVTRCHPLRRLRPEIDELASEISLRLIRVRVE